MDDLISRKALLEELQEAYDNAHRIFQNQNSPESQECCKLQLRTLRSVIKAVKEAPAVEAEPVRHGRWGEPQINGFDGTQLLFVRPCSECGHQTDMYRPRFCPNCGAKMDGGKRDDHLQR